MAGWGYRGKANRMGRRITISTADERHEWPGDRLTRLLRMEQEIARFRNGYTAYGSPERHELDRILADEEGK